MLRKYRETGCGSANAAMCRLASFRLAGKAAVPGKKTTLAMRLLRNENHSIKLGAGAAGAGPPFEFSAGYVQ
jgi:hypothetical protein